MKEQITKRIFLTSLSILKKVLNLGEYKFGKKSKDFQHFREQVFDYFYKELKKLFKTLEKEKIIKRCNNKCNLKNGYSNCSCGGSGWINIE